MQDGTLPSPGHPAETGAARGDLLSPDCPTRLLLDRIGDKWSVLILLLLGETARRFNDLKRGVGVSQKMLSQTLRSLERDGLITREVETSTPIKVTYRITPLGSELLEALRPMIGWAESRMAAVSTANRRYDERRAQAGT